VETLSIDRMGVNGGARMFHRFDFFNKAYNPVGQEKVYSAAGESVNLAC